MQNKKKTKQKRVFNIVITSVNLNTNECQIIIL